MSALLQLSLSEVAKGLQAKEYKVEEVVSACLDRTVATEPKLNACISVLAEQALARARELDAAGPPCPAPSSGCGNAGSTPVVPVGEIAQSLWGVPIGLKDNISLKGSRQTCASRFMENFQPCYNAEVSDRLLAAGAVITAKHNLDEFAMGAGTENSAFGRTHNPWDLDRVPGGSSGGSAAAVAARQCYAALGSDTGGSIRQPAGFCGCVGLKPSYGRVSRYGVAAFGTSFDQVGPLTRTVEDCARLLAVIAGPDAKDATSARLDLFPDNLPGQDFVAQALIGASREPGELLKGLKIGLPVEFWESGVSAEVEAACRDILNKLEGFGAILLPVSLPHQKYALAAYQVMSTAEASTNLARFDGVRFGRRGIPSDSSAAFDDLQELYIASRSQGFGPEVQRRIVLGTYMLSSGCYETYYRKAAQVRRLLVQDFEKALGSAVAGASAASGTCDLLLAPTSAATACKQGALAGDPLMAYKMDLLTIGLNLVGLPGLALPVGLGRESKLPVSLQVMGRAFDEAAMLRLGAVIERLAPAVGEPGGVEAVCK
ncbi:MAG: Asp-tRNA(Asn)/Glu-tRNA(Gln) amidotransferase subunit GatA [Deltaproteobacteria bacterium]|nr:Asp-tRNA(Asn)/Glu-tRNA(Gln) amidotransferase subunit GatA [Deltaproteobacteria bacterium]